MKDHWDELDNHPARIRMAEFGTRDFSCTLDDGEDLLTFFGQADYRVDSEGTTITEVRYWPRNEGMREAVEEWVSMNLL